MKQLTTKPVVMAWMLQGLLYSLLISALMSSGVFMLMAGIWLEFSGSHSAVFVNIASASDGSQQTVVSIMADSGGVHLDSALMLLSSRDSQGLLTLFLLWQVSLYCVFSMMLCWLILRWQKQVITLVIAVATFFLVSVRFVNQMLPSQLDSAYLLNTFLVALVIIVATLVVKRLNKRHALAPKQQTLIAYASQSGTAKNVALKMAQSSQVSCDIRAFSQLTPQCLLGYNQLFVVASTYGDGQAPEKSLGFSQALTQGQQSLTHLSYAVLALGDKAYPHFCAFGHQMANLLSDKGAVAIHPVQEIDRGDASVIGGWWQQIGEMLGWQSVELEHHWIDGTVVNNDCLNTQQPQRPAHVITIRADDVSYQAGDLLEVLTPTPIIDIDHKLLQFGLAPQTIVTMNGEQCQLNHALTQLEWTNQVANSAQRLVDKLSSIRPRVYSIASAPNDNHIRLLVRQLKKDDGSLGFSSSALCNALTHQQFQISIREHDSFRLPAKHVPIIMIAAGTGIAPFMSFLAQRAVQNSGDSWLIFGEQYSNHDNYFNAELDDHLVSGVLNRLDYAFSRDTTWRNAGHPRYVNEVMTQQNRQLYHWLVEKGAHLYVCGNKAGMGESVKTALQQLLKQNYDNLKQANRLHFDLY